MAERTALGNFVQQVDRYEQVEPDSDYSLLGMRSRIVGPFIRETKKGAEISAAKLNRVNRGDFIYSRLFAWQGSFGLIPPEMDGCYVSNEFPLYSLDKSVVSPEYLVYWFGLTHIQKRVEPDCSGSTPGTRNRFKEVYFENLDIELPPLVEQLKIVARVKLLSDKNADVISLREQSLIDAQAMLHSAFEQIIEGAEYWPMAEVAPLVRRKIEIDFNSEYPELGVRCFGKGTFHKPILDGVDVGTKKLYQMVPGDLVFSNVFAWEGAIAVVKKEDEGRVASHRFITCKARKDVATSDFLCFYFLANEGLEKIQVASPGGAGRNRTLGLKKLEKIEVPVPDYQKQLWFNQLQYKVEQIKQAQAENAVELEALMPSILDKAFKGELL